MKGELTMDKVFIAVLNMSFTGAFVIAVICAARLALKKAPKIISYCMWALAGFRLVFPFSVKSALSLMPFNSQPIPGDIAMQSAARINSGIPFINSTLSSLLPPAQAAASVNPLQVWTAIGAFVWFFGAVLMIAYGIISYVLLKRKMREAIHAEANIYEAENIKTPFLLGILVPKIYLPAGLSARERDYVVFHEKTHIKRRDYLIKLFAYFVLCLHWFNPLVWVSFLLMNADMEMSCDERVLKEMGGEVKRDYSLSLLSLASQRRFVSGSPLAFGEGSVKQRIKNVLDFRKPSRIIIMASVILAAALSLGFAVDRANEAGGANTSNGADTASGSDTNTTRFMTLDDVRDIAQKFGAELKMSDLTHFTGTDVGSGIYIMQYDIAGTDYVLLVGSRDTADILYAHLFRSAGTGNENSIDIRYYDVDKFIADGTTELIRPLPDDAPDETAGTVNPAQAIPQRAPLLDVNLVT
jgi:beta-lactamase regulating signal transducer with metallopeptidase domain